jgi:hypothetical protein
MFFSGSLNGPVHLEQCRPGSNLNQPAAQRRTPIPSHVRVTLMLTDRSVSINIAAAVRPRRHLFVASMCVHVHRCPYPLCHPHAKGKFVFPSHPHLTITIWLPLLRHSSTRLVDADEPPGQASARATTCSLLRHPHGA